MNKLLYYLLLKPISWLPLSISYGLSTATYWILFRVIGFRGEVIKKNLTRSFPEKSLAEIKAIHQKFGRHFCDILVESIRLFSISKKEVMARCEVINFELVEKFYREGRHLIVVSGHYNNWELAAQAVSCMPHYRYVGIYKPLKDPFMNEQAVLSRAKFGMELLPKNEVDSHFNDPNKPLCTYFFANDQSPSNPARAYWLSFLHQETGVLFGIEKYARQFNCPVVYGHIAKRKRGYYSINFHLISAEPANEAYGAITQRHTRLTEQAIREAPANWLWTHKRWKHQRPDGMALNERVD